jgi:O-acetyl-ADP-ribose deacetylase (regulator of RNase III)
MISIMKGDILSIPQGVICHQVNCMGKMGAGIALKIRQKWPVVYQGYMYAYRNQQLVLGATILSEIIPAQLYVANLCGQFHYGRDKRYTDYLAVEACLRKVDVVANDLKLPVYIPHGMGCSLAGGDWDTVFSIIKGTLQKAVIVDYN